MSKKKDKACTADGQAENISTEECEHMHTADQAEKLAQQANQQGAQNEAQQDAEHASPQNTELAELQAQLDQQKAQTEEYLNTLQRLQADFENFRRRTKLEKEQLLKYGAEGLICELLPVLDNLERALTAKGDEASLQKGVEMVHKQLIDLLATQGLQPIGAVGHDFDPNLHQAVMKVPTSDYPDNQVVEEFQKGYQLKEKVIRPAMVKVATAE